MNAAGGGWAGGFYFFEEAGAAEAAGGFGFGGDWDHVGKLGAPATAFGLAGHGGIALGAASFHGEIMASFFVGGQCGRGASGLVTAVANRDKGARIRSGWCKA
jgi:hypothetical protein